MLTRTTFFSAACALLSLPPAGCGLEGLLTPNAVPSAADESAVYELAGQRFRVVTAVEGLEVPWAIAFDATGRTLFVTERPGRLRAFDLAAGVELFTHVLDDVAPPAFRGERGLMGLTRSPNWEQDRTLFVSYTALTADGGVRNVIDRFVVGADNTLSQAGPILDNLPANFIHDGLGLRFGPDGALYASTGDALQGAGAQDLNYLGGKFLRINADGSIPPGNPFPGSPVWTLGHRNPQGFDFHPRLPDVLMATEHGSSFPLDGAGGEDELNRVIAGRNYGWPDVRGAQVLAGFESPLWQSGADAVAPSGGAFCSGARYPAWADAFVFATLRGASLFIAKLNDDATALVSIDRGLRDQFGRLRAVAQGPDGYLYISTSNRDGRGSPGPRDDRILRLEPVE